VSLDPQHCVTCSDEAVPARVLEVEGTNATVEADGRRERVGIELVEPVEPGDTLLCHAGIALEKLA
jgi:hydrogenase assembly chaperone HypC/HupF